jgi:triacylglycerol lipase
MQKTLTLLLDGWLGSSWRLEPMRRHLEPLCGSVQIWPYDTSGRKGLDTLAVQLVEHLKKLHQPVRLVGFSMGGIVIREALRQCPELPVPSAAFLHSPHQGTILAKLIPFLPALKQLRPGSTFLQQLNSTTWNRPSLNVWCPGDLIVVPGSNARWSECSEELCCRVPAHIQPLLSKKWHLKIAAFLNQPEPLLQDGKIFCSRS